MTKTEALTKVPAVTLSFWLIKILPWKALAKLGPGRTVFAMPLVLRDVFP